VEDEGYGGYAACLQRCKKNEPSGRSLNHHHAQPWQHACVTGLEGIVAKRRDSRYRSGRSRDWIKVKNPAHPAIERATLIALSKRQKKR
jgi:ATP-dependent DNA ligase